METTTEERARQAVVREYEKTLEIDDAEILWKAQFWLSSDVGEQEVRLIKTPWGSGLHIWVGSSMGRTSIQGLYDIGSLDALIAALQMARTQVRFFAE